MSAKPRILHIEDTSIIIELVAQIIGDYADISPVTTVKEANELLSSNKYDLVILDLTLPDGSGMDLLESLKKDNPELPVLIHSAHEVSDNIRHVDAVIRKSHMEKDNFINTIKDLIENKTPAEE